MNLFSGLCLDPTQMTAEDIRLIDIAHPLSLICRGVGQVKFFFSVAQHSINCAKEAEARGYSPEVQLACLLHDAGEAYCSDVIRPVKKHLQGYTEIEKNIQKAVMEHFGVLDIWAGDGWEKVREIDNDMLTNEACTLFTDPRPFTRAPMALEPDISPKPFEEAEREFVSLCETLELQVCK